MWLWFIWMTKFIVLVIWIQWTANFCSSNLHTAKRNSLLKVVSTQVLLLHKHTQAPKAPSSQYKKSWITALTGCGKEQQKKSCFLCNSCLNKVCIVCLTVWLPLLNCPNHWGNHTVHLSFHYLALPLSLSFSQLPGDALHVYRPVEGAGSSHRRQSPVSRLPDALWTQGELGG